MLRSRYKWTKNPADKELETKIYYPDMDVFNKLVAEKEEVLDQVKLSIVDENIAGKSKTTYISPIKSPFLPIFAVKIVVFVSLNDGFLLKSCLIYSIEKLVYLL